MRGELLQLSSNTCECVWHMGDEGNDTTHFMSGAKELGLWCYCGHLNWLLIEQVFSPAGPSWGSRYMGSHIRSKIPNIIELGQLKPGIWDSGAISSTRWGAASAPTWGCLGFAPNRWSKQCGWTFFPIFLLRLGSSHLYVDCFFGLPCDLGGFLVYDVEISNWGRGWWKSLQCLSMAEVVDLECSLTFSPRALEVSPMYEELHPSALHLRVLTPLKQTLYVALY